MLRKGLTIIERFFWTMIWIFFILIAGYAVLAYVQGHFGNNILGNIASWVSARAQPQS